MKYTKGLIAIALSAPTFACSDGPTPPPGDALLTLSPDSVVIGVGDAALLSAMVLNASGQVQYLSRDPKIATVSASGAIRAVGEGSTYVIGTLSDRPDVPDSVRVRVLGQATGVDACPESRPTFTVATDAERSVFAYDTKAPLNLKKTALSTTSAARVTDITYDSPAGGAVIGVMAEPIGRTGLRPGLVILHPSETPAKSMAPYAQLRATQGAVAIIVDAPYFRRSGGAPAPYMTWTTQDRSDQIQLMQDLQRAVDVLIATGQVDPAKIGFEGYSYGGIMGAGFVAIERRLKAAVLTAPNGGLVTLATMPGKLANLSNLSCATRAMWFQAMVPLEPIRFVPQNSTTAVLVQAGRLDIFVLPSDAQALYDAVRAPKELLWYDTGHGLNLQAQGDKHDWLHKHIGLDPRGGF